MARVLSGADRCRCRHILRAELALIGVDLLLPTVQVAVTSKRALVEAVFYRMVVSVLVVNYLVVVVCFSLLVVAVTT